MMRARVKIKLTKNKPQPSPKASNIVLVKTSVPVANCSEFCCHTSEFYHFYSFKKFI